MPFFHTWQSVFPQPATTFLFFLTCQSVFPPPVTKYGSILPHLTVGISTLFAISKFLSFLADGRYLQHIPPHVFYYSSPCSLHFQNRSTHVAPFVLIWRLVFPHTGFNLNLLTGYFHRWPPYMAHYPPSPQRQWHFLTRLLQTGSILSHLARCIPQTATFCLTL